METIQEMSGRGMLGFVLGYCQPIRCVGASHCNASLGQAKLDTNGHTRVEKLNGAGEGNRTLVSTVGRSHSTIEPHPHQEGLV